MLIELFDKVSSAIDQKQFTVGVLLDLSKAFDTVNHSILFDKLECYGIRGLALDWIKSNFSSRPQFAQFNEYCFSPQRIRSGVPQGSILGPLFFFPCSTARVQIGTPSRFLMKSCVLDLMCTCTLMRAHEQMFPSNGHTQ